MADKEFVCEVCDELVKGNRSGCEQCGRVYGPECKSGIDEVCIDCEERGPLP